MMWSTSPSSTFDTSSAYAFAMTIPCSDIGAVSALATPKMVLEATLDQTVALLRMALKTARGIEKDDALQHKAAQVAALAAQVQRQCSHAANKQFLPLQSSNNGGKGCNSVAQQHKEDPQPVIWSGFYNKTLLERFDILALMYPEIKTLKAQQTSDVGAASGILAPIGSAARIGDLPLHTANLMIENCIGVLGVPLGLGLNFIIDGKSLSVPMAVEEPSVVAAASSAAKLVATAGGGFCTATSGNIMTSQIQLLDTKDIPSAIVAIERNRERLLMIANTTLCSSMKKRGGGAVDIYCRVVSQAARTALTSALGNVWYTPCSDEVLVNAFEPQTQFLVVHIDVDVCEAMGANVVNTVAEGLSEEISKLTLSNVGLRILTNLCMQRRARAEFEIPINKLGWKGVDGKDVAGRIVDAYNFAAIDPYRAVTHNKGIMNGVDAVAVATGQDWRAIEAAAHCYASRSGQYASLSHYEIGFSRDGGGTSVLRGSLEMPIAVGSKGGALMTHPGYTATHAILQQPSARNLSGIIVSVGLAQNFAAIRAIAVMGIQKGHMALHARNIAVAAGAPCEVVSEVCSYMLLRNAINVETAKDYLHARAVFGIGVDVALVSRFERSYARFKERLLKRAFHPQEIDEFFARPSSERAKFLASRWAVKEATFKAFQRYRLLFPEIYTMRGDINELAISTSLPATKKSKALRLMFSGETEFLAKRLQLVVRINTDSCSSLHVAFLVFGQDPLVSIAHDGDYALAYVLLQRIVDDTFTK
ncbi:uncharacterized protein CCR75_003149 [Bremia lactucae]|uniref:4'-phosphopantetheinyl transferase domain-containing protein n=1 Tax=Bremia lactucae TaxID=4779 RepID=A0A976NXZ7_BRELC|nr:hypothetical protein CCR75_003149 [Bremia lactucae]